jgi:hypothetical protein
VQANPNTNFATAVPGSGVVILGANSTWANISHPEIDSTQDLTVPTSCGTNSTLVDCLAVDSTSHTVGMLAFGSDGALYVSTGDASSYGRVDPRAARVQDLNSLSGKILRIDPITGQGLPTNPYFDPAAPASNRSKVYSYGLRNPFRFALGPQTSEPYIGDVGWNNWEEVNTGAGANFGWPFYEGGPGVSLRTNGYQDLPEAQAFYASGTPTVAPLHARSHGEGAVSIIMGDFYTGTTYPALYHNALFITDLLEATIDVLTFGAGGEVTGTYRFADDIPGIVQMKMGADDNLYFLNLFTGRIERFLPTQGGAFAQSDSPSDGITQAGGSKTFASFRTTVADGLDIQGGAGSPGGEPTAPANSALPASAGGYVPPSAHDAAVEHLYGWVARPESSKGVGALALPSTPFSKPQGVPHGILGHPQGVSERPGHRKTWSIPAASLTPPLKSPLAAGIEAT